MPKSSVSYAKDHPLVQALLDRLVYGVNAILRDNVIGVYLYGSLVTGDFDAKISDIDLVVVMTRALDDCRFQRLHQLHQQVINGYPDWNDRLELAYITRDALKTFRQRSSRIAIMSPGEAFHQLHAGADWLISWYPLRENGVALFGPAVTTLIDPITKYEYVDTVQEHIVSYRQALDSPQSKSNLSYIVLTTARGLYTVLHRQPPSKIKAAAWAAKSFPQWEVLIQRALLWRKDPTIDSLTATEIQPQVRKFVIAMLDNLP